jgi:hypothetical protein
LLQKKLNLLDSQNIDPMVAAPQAYIKAGDFSRIAPESPQRITNAPWISLATSVKDTPS